MFLAAICFLAMSVMWLIIEEFFPRIEPVTNGLALLALIFFLGFLVFSTMDAIFQFLDKRSK